MLFCWQVGKSSISAFSVEAIVDDLGRLRCGSLRRGRVERCCRRRAWRELPMWRILPAARALRRTSRDFGVEERVSPQEWYL